MGSEALPIPVGFEGWVWRTVPGGAGVPRHRHDELEFNLVVRGRATYVLADSRVPLRRHVLTWLFPAQDHILIDPSPDFEMWIAVFRPELCQEVGQDLPELLERDPGVPCSRTLPERPVARLVAVLEGLETAAEDRARVASGLRYLLLEAWHAYGQAEAHVFEDVHPAVERAALLIRAQPQLESIDAIARASGLSSSRLSHVFRSELGISLVKYRNQVRLERFWELYGDGRRLRVGEALMQAGFGSYPQFYRVFRSAHDRSPTLLTRRPAAGSEL